MNLIDCETLWHFCLCVSIFVIIFHSSVSFMSLKIHIWGKRNVRYFNIYWWEIHQDCNSLSTLECLNTDGHTHCHSDEKSCNLTKFPYFQYIKVVVFLPKPKAQRWLSIWPSPCSLLSQIGILTSIPRNGKFSPSRWSTAQTDTSPPQKIFCECPCPLPVKSLLYIRYDKSTHTYFVVFLPIATSERLVKCRGRPVRISDILPPVVSIENAATFHLMEFLIFNHNNSVHYCYCQYVLLDRVPDLLEGLLLCLLGLVPRGVVLIHVEALVQRCLEPVKQVTLVNKNAEDDDT